MIPTIESGGLDSIVEATVQDTHEGQRIWMRFWDSGFRGTPTAGPLNPSSSDVGGTEKAMNGPYLGEGTPILPVVVGERKGGQYELWIEALSS